MSCMVLSDGLVLTKSNNVFYEGDATKGLTIDQMGYGCTRMIRDDIWHAANLMVDNEEDIDDILLHRPDLALKDHLDYLTHTELERCIEMYPGYIVDDWDNFPEYVQEIFIRDHGMIAGVCLSKDSLTDAQFELLNSVTKGAAWRHFDNQGTFESYKKYNGMKSPKYNFYNIVGCMLLMMWSILMGREVGEANAVILILATMMLPVVWLNLDIHNRNLRKNYEIRLRNNK